MDTEDYRASVNKRIEELQTLILDQVRELHAALASVREELREVKLRLQRSESAARRF